MSADDRLILHVDMDAFFASVELLRRPELRGKPVVVGGTGSRGVVAAASYEARSYGIHSAMPSARARRLCPQAVFLPGDHRHYAEVSSSIMAIFRRWTPLVEPLSLDEAFLDLSGVRRTIGDPVSAAHRLREEVLVETSLWCSMGLARNKFLAKLSTGFAKPSATRSGPAPGSGVFHLSADREQSFLRELPVGRIWGVGPATLGKLQALGIRTAGDLATIHPTVLAAAIGSSAAHRLQALANGSDDRPVIADADPKSISHEETFPSDLVDRDDLHIHLVRQAEAVAGRLRRQSLRARTVQIKIRYGSFETLTRSRTLARPTDRGDLIAGTAEEMLAAVDVSRGLRLLGVGVSGLTDADVPEQLSFQDLGTEGSRRAVAWERANSAVDSIRAKFGDITIGPASLRGRHRTPGDGQWGPDQPGDD